MKKYLRILTATLLFPAMLLSACGPTAPGVTTAGTDPASPDGQPDDNRIDLSAYTSIVYPEGSESRLKNAISYFRYGLSSVASPEILAKPSDSEPEEGKCILIGATSDPVSAEAAALMEGTEKEHSYALLFTEDRIAIVGSDTDAAMVGMKYFLTHYVDEADGGRIEAAAGDRYVGGYGDEITIFENLVQWELELTSTIEAPSGKNRSATLKYPSIIELNHQSDESKNGILIATGERWMDDHMCPVYRSTDGGVTWEHVTGLTDPFHEGHRTAFAPCVFELPYAVGDMPAGTLILGSDSINEPWTAVYIVLWRSFDQGSTWEAFTTLAGSSTAESGGNFAVWEPTFVCTEDGTLIVHYSDDADPVYNQKLVLKYTKDGKNWSDPVETVALRDHGLRAGMPVVTRLGNGRYMMVYEIVGMAGNPVYCKFTDDPLDWGNPADSGKLIRSGRNSLAATPWVAWSPVGGKDGMLVVTGWRMATGRSDTGSDIFISFDGGDSWITIPNYYSYTWTNDNDTWGYSASIYFSDDGETMFYMANPQGDTKVRSTWFTLFKIKVT